MGAASITTTFEDYFTVLLADTPELRDRVYRIRYDVYCEEFGYEPKDRFPDRKEQDEYDSVSRHCLIIHRPSGMAAACVRMVPADASDPSKPLPFERHCAHSLDQGRLAQLALPRSTVCELSRLAVHQTFRRRAGEQSSRYGDASKLDFSPAERRTLPYIAISAYLAVIATSEIINRSNGFAMMEPFLPRLLGRAGMHFTRVGKDVDYHGIRGPYFISAETAIQGMRPELRDLYEMIAASLHSETPIL